MPDPILRTINHLLVYVVLKRTAKYVSIATCYYAILSYIELLKLLVQIKNSTVQALVNSIVQNRDKITKISECCCHVISGSITITWVRLTESMQRYDERSYKLS